MPSPDICTYRQSDTCIKNTIFENIVAQVDQTFVNKIDVDYIHF